MGYHVPVTSATFQLSCAIFTNSTSCACDFSLFLGQPGDRGALHCHWNAIAHDPDKFLFRRAAFYQGLKSKVGLAAAKAATMRILNIHGCGVVALPVHAPLRAPLLLDLLTTFLPHTIPFPRPLDRGGQTSPHSLEARSISKHMSTILAASSPSRHSYLLGTAVKNYN